MKIARRFNAGEPRPRWTSPEGTADLMASDISVQPSLRDSTLPQSHSRRSNAGLFSRCPSGTNPRPSA